MSRDSTGTYVLPAGNPVTPGTIIESMWANTTMPDLGNEITNSLDRNGRGGMLAPLKIFDGSVSAPGLGFTQDPNNGMARIGTDNWVLVAGGVAVADLQAAQFKVNVAARFVGDVTFDTTSEINFNGDISIGGALNVDGITTLTSPLKVNNPTGTAALYGYYGIVPGGAVGLARFFGNGNTPSLGPVVGGGIEVVANQAWSDDNTGTNVNVVATKVNTNTTATVMEFSASGSIHHASLNVRNTLNSAPTTGLITFGNAATGQVSFDGTNFTISGASWTTIANNVAVGNVLQYKAAQPVPVTVNIGGVTTVNFANGLAQILTMTVPGTVGFTGIPVGAILRTTFINTNFGLTITGVQWPNGVTPDFATGPLKKAIVVIQNDGTHLLGTYTVY